MIIDKLAVAAVADYVWMLISIMLMLILSSVRLTDDTNRWWALVSDCDNAHENNLS